MRWAILVASVLLVDVAARAAEAPLAVKVTRAADEQSDRIKVDLTNHSPDELREVTLRLTVAQADGVTLESRVVVRNIAAGERAPAFVMVPGLDEADAIGKVTVESASVVTGKKGRPVAMDVALDDSGL
jgi:hypothetical protein